MTITRNPELWRGSEPEDIEAYLIELAESEGTYPVTSYRRIVCSCGSDAFKVERSCEETRLSCAHCNAERYILSCVEGWDEAVEEDGIESIECVGCSSSLTNVGAGFASYDNVEGIKWCYVGLRCIICGALSCVNDFKVGWGPAEEVYKQI